jgi:hypothetical protein
MAKPQACGINFSAFGADRRPVLATVTDQGDGVIVAQVEPLPAFAGKIRLAEPVEDLFKRWSEPLAGLSRPLAVDVALDITTLAQPARWNWQLTHRPLDFAFYGDAPVADHIGAFGVRFRALLADRAMRPGKDVIEASPGACIEFFEFRGNWRSGAAHQGKKGWRPDDSSRGADKALAVIAQELGFNADDGDTRGRMDAGTLEAVLCALTALALAEGRKELARGDALAPEVTARCLRRMAHEGDAPGQPFHVPASVVALTRPFWQAVMLKQS